MCADQLMVATDPAPRNHTIGDVEDHGANVPQGEPHTQHFRRRRMTFLP